jgi:hypothetical protein
MQGYRMGIDKGTNEDLIRLTAGLKYDAGEVKRCFDIWLGYGQPSKQEQWVNYEGRV